MAESIFTTEKANQRLLFEINGGRLTIYTLSINKKNRRNMILRFGEPAPTMYYAHLRQGGWDEKPLTDLFDQTNEKAKKVMTYQNYNDMNGLVVNGGYSLFRLYQRWQEPGKNLTAQANVLGVEELEKKERNGFNNLLDGKNHFQPLRITRWPDAKYDGGCAIFLPTHDYTKVNENDDDDDLKIMPAIARIPTNVYLSHLIDIGDYNRFFNDEYVRNFERQEAFNNYDISGISNISLSELNPNEQSKAENKAKNDEEVLRLLKINKHIQ